MEDLSRYSGPAVTLSQCDPRGGTCDFEYVGGTTYECTTHPGARHTCDTKCNLKTQTTLGYVCPISRRYFGRSVCTSFWDKNGNDEFDHTFEPIDVEEDHAPPAPGNNGKTNGGKRVKALAGGALEGNAAAKRARGEGGLDTFNISGPPPAAQPPTKTRKCKPLAAASIESVLKRILVDHVSEYTHELVRLHEFVADQGLSPERYVLGTLYFLAEGFSMGTNAAPGGGAGSSCEANAWLGALLPHPNDLKLRGLQCGNVGKGMEAWRRCILTVRAPGSQSPGSQSPGSPVSITEGISKSVPNDRPTFRNHRQILDQHTNFTTRRSKCPVVML